MGWHPVHDMHAIERARISVRLPDGEKFPEKLINKILKELEINKEEMDLNVSEPMKGTGLNISFSPDGQQFVKQEELGGKIFRKTRGDVQVEAFVFETGAIVFETVEYGRWNLFFDRFKELTSDILPRILEVVNVAVVSIEYTDRFVFEGEDGNPSPTSVVRDISSLLHEDALSGKSLWHLHKGWLEKLNDIPLLINQNFTAQYVEKIDDESAERKEEPKKLSSIQIYTKAEHRLGDNDVSFEWIIEDLEGLHQRANHIFATSLTEDAQSLVNINAQNYAD